MRHNWNLRSNLRLGFRLGLWFRAGRVYQPRVGQVASALLGAAGAGNHLAHVGHAGAGTAVHVQGCPAIISEQDIGALGHRRAKAVGLAAVDDQHQDVAVGRLSQGRSGLNTHARAAVGAVLAV